MVVMEKNGKMVALLHTNEPLWQQFRQFIVQYRMDMRSRFAAHEYVHYYQRDAGCGRIHLPQENTLKWLMEGEAEWLSYTALNKAGQLPFYTDLEQILKIQYQQNQGGLKPLSAYEKVATADVVSSYSYFALALELLMKNRTSKRLIIFALMSGRKNLFLPPLKRLSVSRWIISTSSLKNTLPLCSFSKVRLFFSYFLFLSQIFFHSHFDYLLYERNRKRLG